MFNHPSRRRLAVVTVTCMCYFSMLLLSQLLVLTFDTVSASTGSGMDISKIRTVIDRAGKSVTLSTDDGASPRQISNIVTVITSPGVPSLLLDNQLEASSDDDIPPLFLWDDSILVCQGATLPALDTDETVSATATCLSVCGSVSDVIFLEGITIGDVETANGILNTRHARTLSYLFQSKKQPVESLGTSDGEGTIKKQTLIFAITTTSDADVIDEVKLMNDVRTIYQAETLGSQNAQKKLDDVYDIIIIPVDSSMSGSKILSDKISASSDAASEPRPLLSTIRDAVRNVRDQSVYISNFGGTFATPHIAHIMATISNASMKQTRTVRAKVATWKSRISRGLLIDGFGKEATELRKRLLQMYDTETLNGAGIATVAPYRYEMRQQLQTFIDTSIQQAFTGQVSNLEKLTVKRFNAALLQSVDNNSKESAESILGRNAATMRKEALLFETVIEDLEVPELGLVKDKPIRDVATKLNNALNAFPDSPAAKLKRLQQVTKVVNKEKQPGQRSINFGLDLVAMLRPDGFGSLQGFAGYQLPGGNSVTFGIHNDADDPQVIAQFGGVRPPLFRVQPKLRVDVEM